MRAAMASAPASSTSYPPRHGPLAAAPTAAAGGAAAATAARRHVRRRRRRRPADEPAAAWWEEGEEEEAEEEEAEAEGVARQLFAEAPAVEAPAEAQTFEELCHATLPVLNTAEHFRAARDLARRHGVDQILKELQTKGVVDADGKLTTGDAPFNIFARGAAGATVQPGMEEECDARCG